MEKHYYLLLLLSVGVMIGYTYALDTPQALEVPLRESPYSFTTAQFNLIYFATFLLIGPLSIPLGIAIDRFPIKRTLIMLLSGSFFSQLTIAIMFRLRPTGYKTVVMAMRSIFGLTGEGMFVLLCLIVTIFGKQHYEFLMGAALSLPFFFDALNSLVSTSIYDATKNLPLPWFIGAAVCFLSLLCGIIMNSRIIGEENQSRNDALETPKENSNNSCFREIKELTLEFWVIVAAIFFAEACMGPFNDNLNELLVRRFGVPYIMAGKLLLIPMTGLTLLTFVFGRVLSNNPRLRRLSIVVAALLYLTMMTGLYFLPNCASPSEIHYAIIVGFLISFSVFATVYYSSLTTAIPFFVKKSVLGTAWGLAGSAVGFSQCIIPGLYIFIMGGQSDLTTAFTHLNLFGVGITAITCLLALWIFFRDYSRMDGKYTEVEEETPNDSLQDSLIANKQEQ